MTFELYLHARTTRQNLQQIISRNQSFHAFKNVLITNLNPFLGNGTISELNISVHNATLHIKLVIDVINSSDIIDVQFSSADCRDSWCRYYWSSNTSVMQLERRPHPTRWHTSMISVSPLMLHPQLHHLPLLPER